MARTLSIDLLRTFHAVARVGQFRAAALHLHKTQSAVSMQIQRLEGSVGERLFVRDSRGTALTAAGEHLLGQVAELLALHDRVVATLDDAGPTDRIRLGLPEEYAAPLLRRALSLFAAEHPRVELELETAPSDALREAVDAGELDFAVRVRPITEKDGSAEPLWRMTPVWVGPAHAPVSIADPLPLALHAKQCPYRRAALDTLAAAGRNWRPVLTSPSSSAIEASVEAGLALAVVDRWRVTRMMRVLGMPEGLPDLPPHELVLVGERGRPTEMIRLLAEQFRHSFRVWRQASAPPGPRG